jgi:hypothetical protein
MIVSRLVQASETRGIQGRSIRARPQGHLVQAYASFTKGESDERLALPECGKQFSCLLGITASQSVRKQKANVVNGTATITRELRQQRMPIHSPRRG